MWRTVETFIRQLDSAQLCRADRAPGCQLAPSSPAVTGCTDGGATVTIAALDGVAGDGCGGSAHCVNAVVIARAARSHQLGGGRHAPCESSASAGSVPISEKPGFVLEHFPDSVGSQAMRRSPMKTNAAILWGSVATGRSRRSTPTPQDGEVLVSWEATGLCHSDEHIRTGDLPAPLPMIGGHGGAGIVQEVGPGVQGLKPGDHVVASFLPACGAAGSVRPGIRTCVTSVRSSWRAPRPTAPTGAGPVAEHRCHGVRRTFSQYGTCGHRSSDRRRPLRCPGPACWVAASPPAGARPSTPPTYRPATPSS